MTSLLYVTSYFYQLYLELEILPLLETLPLGLVLSTLDFFDLVNVLCSLGFLFLVEIFGFPEDLDVLEDLDVFFQKIWVGFPEDLDVFF